MVYYLRSISCGCYFSRLSLIVHLHKNWAKNKKLRDSRRRQKTKYKIILIEILVQLRRYLSMYVYERALLSIISVDKNYVNFLHMNYVALIGVHDS